MDGTGHCMQHRASAIISSKGKDSSRGILLLWWTHLTETLSSKFGTSVGTYACIRSSRGHEALYMEYYQKSRNRLTHQTMNPDEYQKILHDVYRKDKKMVLTHPSGSVGSMRGSGRRGPMSGSGSGSGGSMRQSGSGGLIRASRNSGCNTVYCHSDDWYDWEEKVTPLPGDLYNKRLLTSPEVDAITRHFKFADTRVGINISSGWVCQRYACKTSLIIFEIALLCKTIIFFSSKTLIFFLFLFPAKTIFLFFFFFF